MQPIVHYLDGVLAFVLGWAAVPRGRGLLRSSWYPTIGREGAPLPIKVAAPVPGLEPSREWEMVTGLAARELARGPDIAAIQAQVALKIDAAEHAYNRIVADCAKVFRVAATPTFRPARQLAHQLEPPARQPLAA